MCHEEYFGQNFSVLASTGWQESMAPCPLYVSSGPATEDTRTGSPRPERDCIGSCSQIFDPGALAVKQCLSLAPSLLEWVCPVLQEAMHW